MKAKIFSVIVSIIALVSCQNGERSPMSNNTVELQKYKSTLSVIKQNSTASKNIFDTYSVEQLDNTTGLSNSSVNCIFQDSENLIWIGTWDGLNRYNGNNFKIFRPEPDNKNSLSNQVVLKIGEDANGDIWVLTHHGINRYNKSTYTFYRYYFSADNKTPLSESQFNMAFDASKHVYCAVKGWGIGYFDGNIFQRFSSNLFHDKTVKKIEFLNESEMLILFDDNELYCTYIHTGSDTKGKKISKIKHIQSKVKTFDVLPNQNICIVSANGISKYLIKNNGQYKQILRGKKVDNIIGHSDGGLIFSTKAGYTAIDGAGDEKIISWLKYLQGQKITALQQGNENIIWTGTDGDGIFKLYPQKKSFCLVSKAQMPGLEGGIVRSFLKVDDKSFFVGTKGRGLFCLSRDFYLNQDVSPKYINYNEDNSAVNNSVYALSKGNNGLVFIGTDGQGLTIYDLKNSKITGWKEITGSNNCDYFRSVYTIYQDNAGYVWLGTNGYGMIGCRIVRAGDKLKITDFKRYTADTSGKDKLTSNIIFSILPEDNNKLWVGTRLGGLNLFDKRTGSFKTYKNIPDDPSSLSSNDILSIVKGVDNKLWIGTSYGLNLLEVRNNGDAIFKNFTVKDGLPNNTIHGIVALAESNLWVSTNFGLSNFSLNPDKFTNYSKNEGLQNNEFSDGASYYDAASGYIFMGGIKGFNYFLPQKIKESVLIPNLFIDRISGQNQSVPYYQGMTVAPDAQNYPSITLKHYQNFFDVHLSALTFTNNEKCSYSYELKGFDKGWNNIGSRKIISFTNVPRGNYELWLKWSNPDGVWSKPVHAVNITVKPVWWQSNSALLAYSALTVFFILFVRSYYLKRKSLQQNLLLIKHEEELHENRLTFFTNIAHEFLTPLTLIAGPAQKMSETANLDVKNRKFMTMIQRNTSRLLFLTQQLLEFRKAEYEYLEVTVKNFDLVNLIEQIAELFDDWALDKNIDYSIDVPSELCGWFDKDKVEKIVFNLMSNAFKYTPVNGKITITCRLEEEEAVAKLNLTIANTGKGIPKEKLDSLFDRFFLSDTNQTTNTELFRTGIGLAFIKKLVTVLRGEILVKSIPDEETRFIVLIPCSKSSFTEKEIDNESAAVLVSQHLKNILDTSHEEVPEGIPAKIAEFEVIENARKIVLIVEDQKEIHMFLEDLLSDKYRIVSAYNGLEAMEVMQNELPDIIISDVMMPLMDGVELCARVKTDLRTCHIPFIMLTAKNSVVHRIEGLENGANSYIPKPFYPEHLLVRIQKLLEEKELILRHFTQDALVSDKEIPTNNVEKAFIRQAIDIIRQNIDNETLNSALIEKELGISNSNLYRKIKEIFGLSPGDLIRTIRLKYSAELLRKDELTVSEICYKSGFNNRSYFYREFKKIYNTTPKNYQLQHREKRINFSNH